MKRATIEKLKNEAQQWHRYQSEMLLPKPLDDGRRVVKVFVEGYGPEPQEVLVSKEACLQFGR